MSQGCQEPSPQASSGHAQGGSPHCLFPGHLAALTRHPPGHTANDSNSPSPVTERGWRRGRGTPGSEAWRSEVGAGRFAPCPRGSGPHFPGLSLPRRPLIPGRFDSTRRGRGAAVSSPPRWRQRPGGPGCWPEGSARPPHLWLGERALGGCGVSAVGATRLRLRGRVQETDAVPPGGGGVQVGLVLARGSWVTAGLSPRGCARRVPQSSGAPDVDRGQFRSEVAVGTA